MIWNQLLFKVDDMMLRRWHFSDQSSRENKDRQENYFIESGFYWNINWNANELKYMIPFQKHPYTDAQVSFKMRFPLYHQF